MTQIAEEILDERALSAWAGVLGEPTTPRKIAHGRVWAVTTADGHQFVLKRLADTDIDERYRRFVEQSRIVAHLAGRGVPVAVPVLCDDGRVAVEHDGGLYALTPMLSVPHGSLPTAESVIRKDEYYSNVGAVIGQMHAALADCPYPFDGMTIDADRFADAWTRCRDRLPAEVLQRLGDRVDPHRERVAAVLTVPDPQRLHGDCHGANIMVEDDRVIGVIDVEHLPIGPRAFDLGYHLAFLAFWLVETDVLDERGHAGARSATRALVDGYRSRHPLTDDEVATLAPIALFVTIGLIAYFLRDDGGAHERWPETARWVETALWVADNQDDFAYHPTAP